MAALIVAAIPAAGTAEDPIQVFLLAGQSNMVGRALPVSDGTGPAANLLLFRDGSWQAASDPLGPPTDPNRGVGPGMTFGLGVLGHEPPGTRVGLIMCARGASTIRGWQPGGDLFDGCKRMARAAGGTLAGILFLQGESEAMNYDDARLWGQGFEEVETAFEKGLGPVPFVLGEIGNLSSSRAPFAQVVHDAQAAADARHPEVTLVRSVDLPVGPDGMHFTIAAQQELGNRFADAWYSLQQGFPHITGASPAAGAAGVAVTITGSALDAASSVSFGGVAASFTVDGPEQITAVVPAGAATGRVRVVTPLGAVFGPSFTILPSIASFSPASGPPGTKVVVTGSVLGATTAATLNGLAATFKIVSPTQVKLFVPAGATSGRIALTTADGTAESGGSFTAVPPTVPGPSIDSFSPAGGPAGTKIFVTGSALAGTTSASVNGYPATFKVDSATLVKVWVPAGATSGKIAVTTPDGTTQSGGTFTVVPG